MPGGTELEKLIVALEADTERLRVQLRQAEDVSARSHGNMQRHADDLGRKIDGLTRNFSGLRAVIASAGVVGAIAMVKAATDMASRIGEVAEGLGTTTGKLQEMRYAAEQNAGSADQMDAALQRFVKGVGEAAAGTGELRNVLKDYNINVRDAAGNTRPWEDVLDDVADAMETAGSANERFRIQAAAFGRDGKFMVNVLKEGADGLKAMGEEARRVGAVIDDQTVQQAKRLNDELAQMERIITTQTTTALVSLAPILVDLSEKAATLATRFGAVWQTVFQDSERWSPATVARNIEIFQHRLESVTEQLDQLRTRKSKSSFVDLLGIGEEDLAAEKDTLEHNIGLLQARLAALTHPPTPASGGGAEGGIPEQVRRITDALKDQTAALGMNSREAFIHAQLAKLDGDLREKYGAQIAEQAGRYYDLKAAEDGARAAAEAGTKAAEEEAAARDAVTIAAIDHSNALKEGARALADEIENNWELVEALRQGTAEYDRRKQQLEIEAGLRSRGFTEEQIAAQQRNIDMLIDSRNEIERVRDGYQELESFGTQAFDRIGAAATEMALDTQNSAVTALGVLRALVSEIFQEFVKLAAINPIKNALGLGGSAGLPTLATLFSGGGSLAAANSLWTGGGFSALAGAPASFGAFAFAEGGSPPVGRPSLVGEKGPELIVPQTPSLVVPNRDLGRLGGTAVTLHQNFQVPERMGLVDRAVLAEHAMRIKQETIAAVRDILWRNPRFAPR
jgi:hypothetical protein